MPVEHEQDQKAAIAKGWRNWLFVFTPLFILISTAVLRFGFGLVIPLLIGLLGAAIVYQRLAKGRSWRSIFWGVHA